MLLPMGGCALPGRQTADAIPQPAVEPTVSAIQRAEEAQSGVMLAQYQGPATESESPVELAEAPELLPVPPASELSDDQLELSELESLALSNNPAVAEMRARIEALRGRWVQAGLPFNPVAQYQADEIGSEGAAGLHSVGIGQTIVTADKLQLRQSVIAAEIQRAEANLAADRLRIETDVQTAFTIALVAQRRVELAQQLRRIAAESIEAVNQLLVAAEVSRVALLQAQTELQQAELTVETSQAALAGARRQLASVVGVVELPPATLVGDLERELPEVPYEAALSHLLAASPELADRAAAVNRAQRSLRLAHAEVVPNVTGQVRVGYDTGADDTFTGVQLSLPLPTINRNQGNIRRARAEIAAAQLAQDRTELNLANRLAAVLQRYQTARIRVERLTESILPTAEENLKLSRQAFEVGESDYLQLLTAQRTLFQVRLDALTATADARQASALIDGFLLEGSLDPNRFAPNLDFDPGLN
ncbi:TolC family protein [Candidatus Laterigemmans baculatus]|uniref:TolC family protein n=2 Tax=Candidatus Laterigemmans baculatus TaxID=2770505 RepID=UPI00193BDE3A|nr:TolC family protein [Candidatus Laterigemmans baculatus]